MKTKTKSPAKKKRKPKSPVVHAAAITIPREGLVTVAEAMAFLRIKRTTLWKLIKAERLTKVNINGGSVRITCESLWAIADPRQLHNAKTDAV